MRHNTEQVNGHTIEVIEDCKNIDTPDGVQSELKYIIYVDGVEVQVKKYNGFSTTATEFLHAVQAAEDAVRGMCQMFKYIIN